MKKEVKKIVETNPKPADEGKQESLFNFKSREIKDAGTSAQQHLTKGRPFTIRV